MNKQLLQKLTHLAKLALTEKAETAMLSDLNKICIWIEKLDELDTSDVQPLTTMCLEKNIMREDIPRKSLNHSQGLASTSHSDSNYFRVPKVKD